MLQKCVQGRTLTLKCLLFHTCNALVLMLYISISIFPYFDGYFLKKFLIQSNEKITR